MTNEAKMTNEEAREVLGDVSAYLASRASLENEMLAGHTFTDICNAIMILKQQPCEDCISRLIVQEEITKSIALKENPHQMYKRIQAIPSVTPQRPKGKWLDKKTTIKGAHGLAYGRYGCSVCKRKFPAKSNFCPNCGAEMEGFRNEP